MINLLIQSLEKRLTDFLKEDDSNCRYITLEVPLDNNFPVSTHNHLEHFFLNRSDDCHRLLGLGELLSINASGKQRFEHLKKQFQTLLQQWHLPTRLSPVAFIAFAFDEHDPMSEDWQGLPNTLLKIPLILIKQTASEKCLQLNLELTHNTIEQSFDTIYNLLFDYLSCQTNTKHQRSSCSKSDAQAETTNHSINNQALAQSRQQWHWLNQRALEQIHQGSFEKLVTSRQQWIHLNHSVSLSSLTDKLVQHYPACTILSYISNEKKLVSASPERLIQLQDRHIKSGAIGGTIQKNPAKTQQSLHLIATAKDNPEYAKLLKEHEFIAQDIYQRLDPLCHSLKMPCSPFLMKLHNMYHLETPLEGIVQEKVDIFDIISALHPTPAIAGFPALQARDWLIEHEGYQRGWYTGAFGWLDGNLNGELSVMLRCALLNKTQAHLYAGAGLIKESDPDIEWQETELKMQTILEML